MNNRQFKESQAESLKRPMEGRGKKPISLHPLTLEQALSAAIATGEITDPEIKKPRKPRPRPK
jgi:hypothetical protein